MDVGIGIPNAIQGATGAELLDWAGRADRAGFSSLASIGAVSYPSFEELTVFAAAAAVTERIRLYTNVLIAPARSAAELAKQAATVDQLSQGRLTLGIGAGWRDADYVLTDRDFDDRGDRFDEMLGDLAAAWAGETLADGTRPASPKPVQEGGIPLMIGGTTDATIRRVVEHGAGWTAGGMPPDAVAEFADRVRAAWSDAGREGQPRITALVYYALGDLGDRPAANIAHYYAPMGDETAQMIAGSIITDGDAVEGTVAAFADAGVDELILDPAVSDPTQVDLLADIVL